MKRVGKKNTFKPNIAKLLKTSKTKDDLLESQPSLAHVPDEVIQSIFSFLPIRDLVKVGSVSKRFRRISADNDLWGYHCKQKHWNQQKNAFSSRTIDINGQYTEYIMSKHKSLSHLYNPIHHLVASLKSNAKQDITSEEMKSLYIKHANAHNNWKTNTCLPSRIVLETRYEDFKAGSNKKLFLEASVVKFEAIPHHRIGEYENDNEWTQNKTIQYIAAGFPDGEVKVYDLFTQKVAYQIFPPEFPKAVHELLITTDIHQHIHHNVSEQLFVTAIYFINKMVAAAFYSSAKGYLLHVWKLLENSEYEIVHTMEGHNGTITDIQLNDMMLLSCSLDGNCNIYGMETGELFAVIKTNNPIMNLQISNYRVALASKKIIQVYDLRCYDKIYTIDIPEGQLYHSMYLNDLNYLTIHYFSMTGNHVIQVHNIVEQKMKLQLKTTEQIQGIMFEGDRFVIMGKNTRITTNIIDLNDENSWEKSPLKLNWIEDEIEKMGKGTIDTTIEKQIMDIQFDNFNVYKLIKMGTRIIVNFFDFCVEPLLSRSILLNYIKKSGGFTTDKEVHLEKLYGYLANQPTNAGLVVTTADKSLFNSNIYEFYLSVFVSYSDYHQSPNYFNDLDVIVCRPLLECYLKDYLTISPRCKGKITRASLVVNKPHTIRSFLCETDEGHYVHYEWTVNPETDQ